MSSWTLWEPRLNSIATHARLWAGAAATHPKNRSSSMTSVTGSPAGSAVPAYSCASWSVTMVLPFLVALCVRASTLFWTVSRAPRDVLVLGVLTIRAPHPLRRAGVQGDGWVRALIGCQACKSLQTCTRSTKLRATARMSVPLIVRASPCTRGSGDCFLGGVLCHPRRVERLLPRRDLPGPCPLLPCI
jgi:hypothetical protein